MPLKDNEMGRLSALEQSFLDLHRSVDDMRRCADDDRRAAQSKHEELIDMIRALAEGSPN